MTSPAPHARDTEAGARQIKVSLELDSEDLRRNAERLAERGEDGAAHVLFTAAAHMEAGGQIPEWIGTPVDDEGPPDRPLTTAVAGLRHWTVPAGYAGGGHSSEVVMVRLDDLQRLTERFDEPLTGPRLEPVVAPADRPAPTPAPVAVSENAWQLRVLPGGPEKWMLDDESDVADVVDAMISAGAWALFEQTMDTSDRSPSDSEYRKAVEEVRAALRAAVAPCEDARSEPVAGRVTEAAINVAMVSLARSLGVTVSAPPVRAALEAALLFAAVPGDDEDTVRVPRDREAYWLREVESVNDLRNRDLDTIEALDKAVAELRTAVVRTSVGRATADSPALDRFFERVDRIER